VHGKGQAGTGGVLCFARPEAIALAADGPTLSALSNRFEGRVAAVLFDGANSSLLIDTPGFDQPVRAVLPQAGPLAGINVGAPIHLGWTADASKVFAA
jgi:spermidine/putrescine transport system ATP-binding protein